MRCLTCQRIGHTKKYCRRPETTCSQCAEDGHVSNQCTKTPPRCVNCGGEHNSMSNKRPHYLYKSEVLATMTVHKIPFIEAADIVQDRFHEEGKPYSFAVRRNPQPPRNNRTEGVQPQRPSSGDIPPPTLENTSPIKDQTQNKQTPILTRPIAQQKQPTKLKCQNLPTKKSNPQAKNPINHRAMRRRRKQPKKETKFVPQGLTTHRKKLYLPTANQKNQKVHQKNTPQMKKPQETNQEQENEKFNKRTRDPTSPTKNDQNKKTKNLINELETRR